MTSKLSAFVSYSKLLIEHTWWANTKKCCPTVCRADSAISGKHAVLNDSYYKVTEVGLHPASSATYLPWGNICKTCLGAAAETWRISLGLPRVVSLRAPTLYFSTTFMLLEVSRHGKSVKNKRKSHFCQVTTTTLIYYNYEHISLGLTDMLKAKHM